MYKYKEVELEVVQEDITKLNVDAIVNAANNTLLGGGGVDGAIHLAGGPEILEQCKKIGGCPTGEARITVGGNLASKYVIHTVGPRYKTSKNPSEELKNAYSNSLKLAVEYDLTTIAFPSISTGAYGYPIEEGVKVALASVTDEIDKGLKIKKIAFVLYSESDYKVYKEYFDKNLL